MGSNQGGFWVYDLETGERLAQPFTQNVAITGIEFSDDGSLLAVASEDGTISIWGLGQ